jgi:uncharacterized membrane protein YraQ (UPF0718 family)
LLIYLIKYQERLLTITMNAEHPHTHHHAAEGPVRIGRNLSIALVLFLIVLGASFIEPLRALNESLLSYLGIIWWAVLLGLLLGGLIDYFVPDGVMVRFLGPSQKLSLLYAVIAGFLMSACSHGILAIAVQLYKKGAGVPAVITFLLASPWANLPITILMFGFFGWHAFLFIGGAMVIAFVTGVIFTLLDRLGWIEPSSPSVHADDIAWTRIRHFDFVQSIKGVSRGTLSLANMVLWWIIIGVLIAALLGAYMPQHIFMQYLGPDPLGLTLTLLVATVIEVCSEGTSPIAFEIYNQVGALGNPFVFLMAGVATDYTEIGLLWSNIGRRTAIWLPIVTVPQVVALGIALNMFF